MTKCDPSLHRYTLCPAPELNRELDAMRTAISGEIAASPVAAKIAAVVLGGGYGRGEGGVWRETGKPDRPYNDIDFFVVSRASGRAERAGIDAALGEIGRRWSGRMGVEVEFGPAQDERSLRACAPTLMYQELRRGWVNVYGDDTAFAAFPELDFADLPTSEATRLLLNRGAGLLMSTATGDADFILRNSFKAVFGCGDAWLLLLRRYDHRLAERRQRIRELLPELSEFYEAAAKFKELPYAVSGAEAAEWWRRAAVCWLSAVPAALELADAGREGPLWRNAARNLIAWRMGWRARLFPDHPRKRLLKELRIILFAIYLNRVYSIGYRGSMMDSELWLRLWRRFN